MSKLATLEAVARQLFSKYTAVIKTAVEKMSGDVEDHLEDKANPHGVTKAQVGLSDVQNHGMANKAEAEAGTASDRYMSPVRTKEAIAKFAGGELASHVADSSNPHGVTKDQVGLGNVQNYGMANKTEAEAGTAANRFMTPQRTKEAIDALVGAELAAHAANKANPHGVTKAQVGLGNVDNTTDLNKPLSTATINALANKVDKAVEIIAGPGLVGGGKLDESRTLSINLTASHIPNLDAAKITSGIISSARLPRARLVTVSTSDPDNSVGEDGDIWIKI